MIKREAVIIANRHNEKLVGILESPIAPRKDAVVLLLSPGIKMRVGPNQLYHTLSRIFTDQGFCVLRFDFSGLGDSGGEIHEQRVLKIYNAIQDGCYVDDTVAAIDWIESRLHCSRIIAAGLCGGAITGLLTAVEDRRIEGLVSLGMPVSFEGGEQDYWRFVTDAELKGLEKRYFGNLRRFNSWIRFLTFRSDYRIIFKMLYHYLREITGPKPLPKHEPAREKPSNVNPKFLPAFQHMASQRHPILLIFGGQDRWTFEFTEKFQEPNREVLSQYADVYNVVVVPHANHILSSPAARGKLIKTIGTWTRKQYARKILGEAS
ncbi:MAG: hypothetical protein DWQ09_07435 [Proteobacteria bacterium]|nr:MAG: hypothetical protein DWQ09_07435 [Pseudomonadota bacterium]QKK12079.1 MAG: alpha/beta fold hydrolase [Pseudomonadota bacterium]